MPDLGGLANRLRGKGKPDELGSPDEPDDDAGESDVSKFVERLRSVADSHRPPAGPVVEPWSFGLGAVFAEHPKVPKRLRGLVRRLDRFGGLGISSEHVSFDGDSVKWSDVTEVRGRHLVDYLLGDAVLKQVQTLPLPPFPGRRKLINAYGRAVFMITAATMENALDDVAIDLRVPAEIEYKASFGRRKTFGPGVFAALALMDPAVNECLVSTAKAHDIPVTVSDDGGYADAAERGAAIKQKIVALRAEMDRFTSRFGRDKGDEDDDG